MRSLWISSREQQILLALLSLTFGPYDRQYQKKAGALVGYYTRTKESLVLIFLVCRGVQITLFLSVSCLWLHRTLLLLLCCAHKILIEKNFFLLNNIRQICRSGGHHHNWGSHIHSQKHLDNWCSRIHCISCCQQTDAQLPTLRDRGAGQVGLLLQLEEFVALQVLQEFQVCER